MAKPTVFISYRHGEPSTYIAQTLYTALSVVSSAMGFDLFMDQHDVEPSDLFDKEIKGGLKRTTHFIAVLDNDYWMSNYCRIELGYAIGRYEKKGRPLRLLFVQAGSINPQYISVDPIRAEGKITSKDPLIKRIGDVQVLGPFSKARRLVRFRAEKPSRLCDQIADLVDELRRVLL